jgi:hypothetical protein
MECTRFNFEGDALSAQVPRWPNTTVFIKAHVSLKTPSPAPAPTSKDKGSGSGISRNLNLGYTGGDVSISH